jgi:hypothetical protein
VEEITHFFDRYREFSQKQEIRFQTQFEVLKTAFVKVEQEAREEDRFYAPSFNVFSVLGLSRNEARTHSAMLANLFLPTGSHGQGYLFLKNFFQLCATKHLGFPLPMEEVSLGRWHIRTEEVFNRGRMDIVLRCPDLNCLYVIENKIDAMEQQDQLLRYSNWMKKYEQEFPIQALIFLNIHGYHAISSSGVEYYLLSYHEDISGWLEHSLHEIKAPNVKEVVIQYKKLIENL